MAEQAAACMAQLAAACFQLQQQQLLPGSGGGGGLAVWMPPTGQLVRYGRLEGEPCVAGVYCRYMFTCTRVPDWAACLCSCVCTYA